MSECFRPTVYATTSRRCKGRRSTATKATGTTISCGLCSLELDHLERLHQLWWDAGKRVSLRCQSSEVIYSTMYPQDKNNTVLSKELARKRRGALTDLSDRFHRSSGRLPCFSAERFFRGISCDSCEEPLCHSGSSFPTRSDKHTVNLEGVWEPGRLVRTIHPTKSCWEGLIQQKTFAPQSTVVLCTCASCGRVSYVDEPYQSDNQTDMQTVGGRLTRNTCVDGETIDCGKCRSKKRNDAET